MTDAESCREGDRILGAAGGARPLISGRFLDALASEIKRPWADLCIKLVHAAPLAADGGRFVPLSSPLRQCAWMKVTVKMHAASLL